MEEAGGECTLAPLVEWLWYTNREQQKRLRQAGRTLSVGMAVAKLKNHIQQRDEHRLYAVFHDDLVGYEEPTVDTVLEHSRPYLPHTGSLGEMTLSVGKAVYHYHQGCDGVIDISPFTCMNGIVTEAVYPRVSRRPRRHPDPELLLRRLADAPGARRRDLHGAGAQLRGPQEGGAGLPGRLPVPGRGGSARRARGGMRGQGTGT